MEQHLKISTVLRDLGLKLLAKHEKKAWFALICNNIASEMRKETSSFFRNEGWENYKQLTAIYLKPFNEFVEKNNKFSLSLYGERSNYTDNAELLLYWSNPSVKD